MVDNGYRKELAVVSAKDACGCSVPFACQAYSCTAHGASAEQYAITDPDLTLDRMSGLIGRLIVGCCAQEPEATTTSVPRCLSASAPFTKSWSNCEASENPMS